MQLRADNLRWGRKKDSGLLSTVCGLVSPSSMTSGAEGFFFCNAKGLTLILKPSVQSGAAMRRTKSEHDEIRRKDPGQVTYRPYICSPEQEMITVLKQSSGERSSSLPKKYPELDHLLFNSQYTA